MDVIAAEVVEPERYEDRPITATPRYVAPNEFRYVGELNVYTDSPHPITVELVIPCPPKGVYSYRVDFVRKTNDD